MATGLLALVLLGQGLPALAQATMEYIHTDALGSPVAVTNQAGQVIERNDYEPYGAMIGKPDYQGIGYTGHVQDAATGLTYMQQRYYDPQSGVFLSVDPVTAYNSGDMRHFNPYAYAFNNPYSFTDPDGRCPDGPQTGTRICGGGAGNNVSVIHVNPSGGSGSLASVLGQRAKTPLSQARLIESVGGDTKTLEQARETHENFVTTLTGLATGGVSIGGARNLAVGGAEVVENSFFQGAKLHARVLGQMKSGDMHAFPGAVDGFAARHGVVRVVTDSRGKPVEMLTVRGSYRGKEGAFEYIKNRAGEIYHRFFNAD